VTIKYDVEDIGIDSPSYFSGRRADFTAWDAAFVGSGDDAGKALKDACESAAQSGYKTTDVVWSFISTEKAHDRCAEDWNREHPDYGEETEQERDFERDHEPCDLRYYVALYVSDARTTLGREQD
jgi:hypothetical protein